MSLKDLLPVLQVAIGPVILISGVGLAAAIDDQSVGSHDRPRATTWSTPSETASDGEPTSGLMAQLDVLWRRARWQRAAISLAAAAALLAVGADHRAVRERAARACNRCFRSSLCLSVAWWRLLRRCVCFMCDIDLALHALALELDLDEVGGN